MDEVSEKRDILFEDETPQEVVSLSEEEIEERRQALRLKAQQKTERVLGNTLGNSDVGTDITAQSVFAISIALWESGQPWYYSVAALFFAIFLGMTKKQHKPGPIAQSIRHSRTMFFRIATQDLTAGFTAYASIVFVVYFWHFKQYVAMGYAIAITIFLNILKYKLPISDFSLLLGKNPEQIVDDSRTQNFRKRFMG